MTEWAIETEGLTKRFGRTRAVDDLSLQVPPGSVFGFLGRNGAGKTTTIRVLMDLARPTSGQVEVLSRNPQEAGLFLKQHVGYVGESPAMYGWMKVREAVGFAERVFCEWDQALVDDMLRRFDLPPDQKIKHLSRGMKAQLALVVALGHNPSLLILDEPATGLDVLVRRNFLESVIELIQEGGRTVFLSSHMVHEVERVADTVAIIEKGRLVTCDATSEIKEKVKKILIRVGDGDIDLSGLPGISCVEGEGEQRMVTVREFGTGSLEALKARGAEVLQVVDLSLEDSFVEYVRPFLEEEVAV